MKSTRTLWGPLFAVGMAGTFVACASGGGGSTASPAEQPPATEAGQVADAGQAPDVFEAAPPPEASSRNSMMDDVAAPQGPFTVGGTVAGLVGTGLILQYNNEAQFVTVPPGATTFAFPSPVPSGSSYSVAVAAFPNGPSQTCVVSQGTDTGTVNAADVTSIAVVCATRSFRVGGTVEGLQGSAMVLQDNGADDLPVNSNGVFTFARPVLSGAPFAVTIQTQPSNPPQTCTISGNSGSVGGGAVTGVVVDCSTGEFTVGGMVSGLTGSGLVLSGPGGTLNVNGSGAFTFPPVHSDTGYSVAVAVQPSGQQCTVTNGSGAVGVSNVTNVVVTCVDAHVAGTCDSTTTDGTPCTLSSKCYSSGSPTCQKGVCTGQPPSGIVSWWPGEGNANDVVGMNNGMVNGATFASGKVGQAFSLTSPSYVEIPSSATLSVSAFTFEFWVNEADQGTGTVPRIVSWQDDGAQSPAEIADYFHQGTIGIYTPAIGWVDSGFTIRSAGWVHVAVTHDGSTLRVYGNGALAATFPGALSMDSGPVFFGNRYNLNNEAFDGFVDEPTLYSRALTQTEIQGIYTAGSAGKCR